MQLNIEFSRRAFWRWLCRWTYLRWMAHEPNWRTKKPVGVPGNRDPEHPCTWFAPGKPDGSNTCEGDGHYMCQECVRFDPKNTEE